MTAVIVPANNEFRLRQRLGQFCIPANVFTKSLGDLNDASSIVRAAQSYAGNGKTVPAGKVEWLRCAHYMPIYIGTVRWIPSGDLPFLARPSSILQNPLQYFAGTALRELGSWSIRPCLTAFGLMLAVDLLA
jgi:hypothetical protein